VIGHPRPVGGLHGQIPDILRAQQPLARLERIPAIVAIHARGGQFAIHHLGLRIDPVGHPAPDVQIPVLPPLTI
jgi:hypothetical protein